MSFISTIGGIKALGAATAFLAMAAMSSAASAVSFVGDYTINANRSDPGLVIETMDLANPLNFSLSVPGDSITFGLFEIWTDETSVNLWEDTDWADISVAFDFTSPESAGEVTGATFGTRFIVQEGHVVWDGPGLIDFGSGGQLQISLSDESFNWGVFGLTEGRNFGATVDATFTLVSDSSVIATPIPAGLPLLLSALGGLVFLRKRKEAATA